MCSGVVGKPDALQSFLTSQQAMREPQLRATNGVSQPKDVPGRKQFCPIQNSHQDYDISTY